MFIKDEANISGRVCHSERYFIRFGAGRWFCFQITFTAVAMTIAFNSSKQGVTLTGRNRTGPPCSVGCPTAYTLAPAAADRRRARPARLPAALQTTTTDDRLQRAKQYCSIWRASNK